MSNRKVWRVLRTVVVILMMLSLCLLVSSPTLGETPKLDLDQTVPGFPPISENWRTIPAAEALDSEEVKQYGTAQPWLLVYNAERHAWEPSDTPSTVSKYDWKSYKDGSISVRSEFATLKPAQKKKVIPAAIVYIKIADPSQIRTAMSYDDYKKKAYTSAEKMSAHVNAVAAINGDFFKYHYDVGYVLRQGVFYRNKLNGQRDVLLIDSNGDFHAILGAVTADLEACVGALPEGVTAVNTFSLGPVLVRDGEARNMKETVTAKNGEFQWKYAQQRVAVVQTGNLEYALVETYGKTDGSCGLTLQEFADYIVYNFPDCRLAYNLDGGGSSNVLIDNERIHTTPGHREICDILYFASAGDWEVNEDD